MAEQRDKINDSRPEGHRATVTLDAGLRPPLASITATSRRARLRWRRSRKAGGRS